MLASPIITPRLLGDKLTYTQKRKSNPITFLDRPRGFQEFEVPRFQDSRHMKVVRLSAVYTGCLYPPRKYSWYSFLLQGESTPGPYCGRKDYVNEKNLMTQSGIEPATFRLVAQCLNQLHYRVPPERLLAA